MPPVYTEYGEFKSDKHFRAHLKKLDDLRNEGNWNGWLLLSPPRSFVTWQAQDSSDAVVLYKTTDEVEGLRHWQVTVDGRGRLRVTPNATAKGVDQTVKRRERKGVRFNLTMARIPPDVLNKLHWLDPACLALRDFLHRKDDDPRYDAQQCFRRDCDQVGVYLQDSDQRPWYWYMLCDEHRPDVLDPCNPSVTLQTSVRKKGKVVYVQHRVRQNQGGGTPGPTLCGLERFGKDAPIKGFSVRGGVIGSPNEEICQACAQGDLDLRKSPEFLERRVIWLERESRKTLDAAARTAKGLRTTIGEKVAEISRLRGQVETLQQMRREDTNNINNHARELNDALSKVSFAKAFAHALLDNYSRLMSRLDGAAYDDDWVARLIGYTEATFETVVAQAKEFTNETD